MATIVRCPNHHGQTSYRAQIRRKGVPPLSATFTKPLDADKWVQATEVAILEGRYLPTTEAKRHTLADLMDRYYRDILPAKAPESRRKQSQGQKACQSMLGWHRTHYRRCSLVTPWR